MPNKYGIPEKELDKSRARDKTCVYCHKKMVDPKLGGTRKDWATIEHLNYLPPWNNSITVAICCGSCNSSRGKKKIADWFKKSYCLEKNINSKTFTKLVKEYIRLIENFIDLIPWTFAKTMPEIPHYYVVRDNLAPQDKEKFDAFTKYINDRGYSDIFDSKEYKYLKLGNYKYWVIDNVLNRASLEGEKGVPPSPKASGGHSSHH